MKRIDALRKTAKYLVAGASSLVLLVTAFSTPALAAAKDDLDAFVTNSLSELSQATANGTAPKSIANDEPIVIQGDTVIIQGDTTSNNIQSATQGLSNQVTTVLFKNQITITTDQSGYNSPFYRASWLKYVKADEGAKVSFAPAAGKDAPTLQYFFYSAKNLESIDGLSAWDVSNVKGTSCMRSMFYHTKVSSLDALSAWDVSGVTGTSCMQAMFEECSSLGSLAGLSAWDVSSVTGESCMSTMFSGCSGLSSLDGLSAWDVSGVTGKNCLGWMFYGCSGLSSLDGLSAWNVANVKGEGCMNCMFSNCTNLTSLDGLSAWDVSGVSGEECMQNMFSGCTHLTSIDDISGWDISNASGSTNGVRYMFNGANSIASISLGNPAGFRLDSSMSLPSAYWWSVKAGIAYQTSTSTGDQNLYAQSANTTTNGFRWQRTTSASSNPMTNVSNLSVTWPATDNLTYTGLFQDVTPTVTADGTQLRKGTDFNVVYTYNPTSEALDAMKNAGTYTATVAIRGVYIYAGTPQTGTVTIDPLDLNRDTNPPLVYTQPDTFAYTGTEIKPKTMVGICLNPTSEAKIYAYLTQNTGKTGDAGDYSVAYTNNVGPGKATATVSPAVPAGLSTSNLQGTASANFRIAGDYIVTFESNGGSAVEDQEVMSGQTITEPAAPTKQDYFFAGWYKEDSFTNKWDFATDTVTSNITLYAKWDTAFTVIFDSNGGSAVTTQMVIQGATAKEPTAPTKDGYIFQGWYSDEDLTQAYDFDTPVTSNLTLYAKWQAAPGPTPPGPTPQPTPGSDGDLLPITGDATSTFGSFLTLSAAALLGMASLGFALSMRITKRRQ